MKKANVLSLLSLRVGTIGSLFTLMLFFTLLAGQQDLTAQATKSAPGSGYVVGAPPAFVSSGDAEALILQQMNLLQSQMASLVPGSPAYNAIGKKVIIYDLVYTSLQNGKGVADAIDEAFIAEFGQVPLIYVQPSNSNGFQTGSTIVDQDAKVPNPSAPNYNSQVSLYNEVVDLLSA